MADLSISPDVIRDALKDFVAAYEPAGAAATGAAADKGMWRVPTLRNLTYTAPYMHNGMVKSLPEAVKVMVGTKTSSPALTPTASRARWRAAW